ncbi:MAG: RNA methyltransferase [Bacteroidales bacterium]|nr:RNA methyltransferase [Bacteroidales bacterium]
MSQNMITSLQNPKVKEVVLLQEKAREREKTGLFPVEGLREVSACISSGFEIDSLFLCDDILNGVSFPAGIAEEKIFHVSPKVYSKISYRESTEGILALAKARHTTLEDLHNLISPETSGSKTTYSKPSVPKSSDSKTRQPLIIVAEAVEKPGNLGAILRTADAVGATAVIFANPKTDLYNPNLIRASLGGVFTRTIVCCKSEDAIAFLKSHGIKIYTAQLQDSVPYYGTDMREACAIALGSEADGISDIWRKASDRKIMIPMLGRLDSLNVSVSAAILCYEALRQRSGR